MSSPVRCLGWDAAVSFTNGRFVTSVNANFVVRCNPSTRLVHSLAELREHLSGCSAGPHRFYLIHDFYTHLTNLLRSEVSSERLR
jgi:hypothetical protein